MSASAAQEGEGKNPGDKFVDATGHFLSQADESEQSKPWAGQAFFVVSLVAWTVFYTWFLRA